MYISRKSVSVRIVSLLLIQIMLWSTMLPASVAFAEGEATPPPPTEQVSETLPQEPSTSNENPGDDGLPGEPAPVQDGENGAPSEPGVPAENGESGDSANAPQDPPVSDGTSTIIDTGNASSDSTTVNDVNNTTVTTPPPDLNQYPYGKPPPWFISMCEKYPTPKCDKYIIKPAPQTVEVVNDVVLANAGAATSTTGLNSAVDPDGVSITTGNADSFGYLISLFNVVVTNSTGSILFLRNPLSSALDFTQKIMDIFNNLSSASGECSFLGCSLSDAVFNLINVNTAEVTNELIVRSGTGANAATSTEGIASISTGNATAFGSIVNFGNLQIVDSRYMVILMSNEGDLSGNIVLPEADFFNTLSTGAKIAEGSSVSTTNGVDITNDGLASAGTGSNGAVASSTEEIAQIHSGDAAANSSAINFANQIGAPICFVVNVGGDWRGSVVRLPSGFSREKTDFGEVICGAGRGENRPGGRSNFQATTTNYAKILNKAIVEATTGANSAVGAAARINTGNADAFLQILNVINQSIIGQDWIFALFTVSGDWNGNMVFGADPKSGGGGDSGGGDVLTQIAARMLAGAAGGGTSGGYTSAPKLQVIKTANVISAITPAKIDYKVVVKNNAGGGIAYRAKLSDVMTEPAKGNRIFARSWDLGNIKDGEEITLTYTVEFNTDIPYGVYENKATVTGYRNSSIHVSPNPFEPVSASANVEISEGEIKEVQAGPACKPLLNGYIRIGKQNVPEDVRNLQTFLLVSEGEQIGATGIYDPQTIAAVKRFQQKYSEYILEPWGISTPTGNVYYTTQHTINNMSCKGDAAFSLDETKVNEINSFKAKYQNPAPNAPRPDPVSEGVGSVKKKKPVTPTAIKLPTFVPTSALIPVFAPTSKSEGKSNALGKWMKSMMPFVEALD